VSARQYDVQRREQDPFRRWYSTARWAAIRKIVLARDPLCKIGDVCVRKFGMRMPSTEGDHIEPPSKGGEFWSLDNLQGACHDCNSAKRDRVVQ
jgi:5-methylcytosine-specific restriction endonuclease McrA